jgi:PAS domain S-box-containing protein
MSSTALKVLVLEDVPNDAEIEIAELEGAGLACDWKRVETRADFLSCLELPDYDLILSDYALPSFDGLSALELLLEKKIDIPFIMVSGVMGEDAAIDSLKAGATDYVLKTRLSRLGPVARRALEERETRQERQRAYEALRESEKLYRQVLENSMDAILVTKTDGTILSANPAAENIFKMTEAEICAAGRNGLVELADPRLTELLNKRAAVNKVAGELTMRRKDGSTFPAEISSSTFTNQHGETLSSTIVRDLTERKKAEAITKKRTTELEQFNKMATGRELRMLELKTIINDLCRELGRKAPYNV